MPRGRKQANIRNYNQQQVLKIIRTQTCSCNDIAKILGMSNSSIEDIVDELADIGLIKVSLSNRPKTVGRSPIYYKLNNNFGCVLAVDLLNSKFEVCSMCYDVLLSESFHIGGSFDKGHRYHIAEIKQIIEQIKESLNCEKLKGWTLKSICVATFGKVNKYTGEFVWVNSVDKDINLKEIFSSEFSVPTAVFNDGDLAAVAESEFGKLKGKTKNSIFVTAGEGIVDTLFIEDKIVSGIDYRAGELGFAGCYSEFTGKFERLGTVATLHSIKNNIKRYLEENPKIDSVLRGNESVLNVFKAYHENDEVCLSAVIDSANCIGEVLGTLVNILNCQTVVLAGEVTGFGNRYLNTINQKMNERLSINHNFNVQFSSLSNSTILGAMIEGVQLAINSNLRETK